LRGVRRDNKEQGRILNWEEGGGGNIFSCKIVYNRVLIGTRACQRVPLWKRKNEIEVIREKGRKKR